MEYYDMTSVVYNTQLYEIIPGFIAGLVTMLSVSYLTEAPSGEVLSIFDKVRGAKGVEVSEEGTPLLDGVPFQPKDQEVISKAEAEENAAE